MFKYSFSLLIFLSALLNSNAAPPAKKAEAGRPTTTNEVGLILNDDVPVHSAAGLTDSKGGMLFKNSVVKIKGTSPDKRRVQIESEFGTGWVDATSISRDFDRTALLKTYETSLGMGWFFTRFNMGTNYETMSFEGESFSTEEYRSLFAAAQSKNRDESHPAQIVVSRTVVSRLASRKEAAEPRDRYLAKQLQSETFWTNANSSFRDFWAAMPRQLMDNKNIVLNAIPRGAHLVYDQFSIKLRDDNDVAKAVFAQSPESIQYASTRIKDNEEIVLIAALANPMVIEHASDRLKDNEEIFKKISAGNAMALQFASDRLKNKPDFVLHICAYRPWAIQYASESVRDTASVFLGLASKNPMIIKLASDRLKNDVAFLKEMYRASPETYQSDFYDAAPAKVRHLIDPP
jgi:hypothetical protein